MNLSGSAEPAFPPSIPKEVDLKRIQAQPQFLQVRWEICNEEGSEDIALEAFLCFRHRQEIARKFQSVRGTGQLGEACDLCESRQPRRISAA
jgi:hypothetical protein